MSVGNTSKPYSVRKSIKEIDERLIKIKPTDEVPRMPRKLEKHLQHLKANELQMWLLYYSVPSLLGYLDPVYLDHHALLVEGVYILLSDHIEETKLVRAEMVLTTFYHQFESLYGKNNCTLNVHNVSHLTQYVRRLGPMWAYSCFPFEDMNAALMKLVHGTGDVCLQILRSLQTLKHRCSDNHYLGSTEYRAYIHKLMAFGRKVRIRHVATNCSIAGGMTEFVPESDLSKRLIELLQISSLSDLGPVFKVLRIVIKNVTYFSEQYTCLSTRVGNILLADLDEPEMCIISVLYYLLHQDSNICFCVGTKMPIDDTDPLVHPVVNHIIKIEEREILDFQDFPVNRIKEKLMYLG